MRQKKENKAARDTPMATKEARAKDTMRKMYKKSLAVIWPSDST